MSRTAFFHHPAFLKHVTGRRHPESARRLVAIRERLERGGRIARLLPTEPVPAPIDSVAEIHGPDYLARLQRQCGEGGLFREDADTIGSPGTWNAALLAAGAAIDAADAVMAGAADNAFCAVRPPGHHALRDRGMGFCFLNNVAIAARHLQRRHGVRRIAIVDWDLHHGNGTQDAFHEDPSVFYFSIHQWPHYPGSGIRSDRGRGAGEGFTMNVPVAAGSTDTDYLRVFVEEIRPAIRRFAPEFILVSAGFDAHRDDPLGGICLTEAGFAELTRLVRDMAREHCGGRLVSVLEGGYQLDALAASVEAHLDALME